MLIELNGGYVFEIFSKSKSVKSDPAQLYLFAQAFASMSAEITFCHLVWFKQRELLGTFEFAFGKCGNLGGRKQCSVYLLHCVLLVMGILSFYTSTLEPIVENGFQKVCLCHGF